MGRLSARSTVPVNSKVDAATSSTLLLAANQQRLGASFYNRSTAILYVLCAKDSTEGATVSASVHTVALASGGYYEVPENYVGLIYGIWASVDADVRITEFI